MCKVDAVSRLEAQFIISLYNCKFDSFCFEENILSLFFIMSEHAINMSKGEIGTIQYLNFKLLSHVYRISYLMKMFQMPAVFESLQYL